MIIHCIKKSTIDIDNDFQRCSRRLLNRPVSSSNKMGFEDYLLRPFVNNQVRVLCMQWLHQRMLDSKGCGFEN